METILLALVGAAFLVVLIVQAILFLSVAERLRALEDANIAQLKAMTALHAIVAPATATGEQS